MPPESPQSLTIRTYQVGFGDCFLLSFEYPRDKRHILIDFGSTELPKGSSDDHMHRVAELIKTHCEGKLHAVVATHRHKDHISGFATSAKKDGTGDIIASLNPDVVIQPWTEEPTLQPDATGPVRTNAGDDKGLYVASLSQMQAFANLALQNLDALRGMVDAASLGELKFLGDDNLSNLSAIENLMTMGKHGTPKYVSFGSDHGLEAVLPGVTVTVLGPPTLEQSPGIKSQRSRDADEFWQLTQPEGSGPATDGARPLFENAPVEDDPIYARWFREQAAQARTESLLSLVRVLDDAMNNTSVILLFEVGGKSLLFPGDAQIENWSFALGHEDIKKRLADVNVYKVGHHGSLNATPKASLWPLFSRKSEEASDQRLLTLLSTLEGKHGSESKHTEVPRRTLLAELKNESTLTATDTYKADELSRSITISFK